MQEEARPSVGRAQGLAWSHGFVQSTNRQLKKQVPVFNPVKRFKGTAPLGPVLRKILNPAEALSPRPLSFLAKAATH